MLIIYSSSEYRSDIESLTTLFANLKDPPVEELERIKTILTKDKEGNTMEVV